METSKEFSTFSKVAGSFSELSLLRANSPDGFNMAAEPPSYFLIALVEEVGEVAGVLKKLRRGFNKREKLKAIKKINARVKQIKNEESATDEAAIEALHQMINDDALLEAHWRANLQSKLSKEAADVFIYFDLFCSKANIDWQKEVYLKFNEVNEEMEFDKELFEAIPEIHKI